MPEIYELAKLVVQITGPLMLACIVIMFVSVRLSTGKTPHPSEMMYLYVRNSIAKRKHAGVLTYLLAVCAVFFTIAAATLAYLRLAYPS